MYDQCEVCHKQAGDPVCIDDDMEVYVCASCRKALRKEGMKVEVMDL